MVKRGGVLQMAGAYILGMRYMEKLKYLIVVDSI
jgi:hypothetical protein